MAAVSHLIQAYDDLGLKPGAGLEEVKRAYHRLAKRHHPDLNPQADGQDMARINQAYQHVMTWLSTLRQGHDGLASAFQAYDWAHFHGTGPGQGPDQYHETEPEPQATPEPGPEPEPAPAAPTPEEPTPTGAADADGWQWRVAPGPPPAEPPATQDRVVFDLSLPEWRLLGLKRSEGRLVYRVELIYPGRYIEIPVRRERPCDHCAGSGISQAFARPVRCPACGGRGFSIAPSKVSVEIPAQWHHGQVIPVPMAGGKERIAVELLRPREADHATVQ